MSIVDHVAIFLMGSLDQPRQGSNKKKPPTFWGQFAFPPGAQSDLLDACKAVAPGGSLNGLQLAPKLHGKMADAKKFPGIPDDWFIVRIATGADHLPELYLADGTKITALAINGGQIRSEFYSGQRVRVNTYAYTYPSKEGGDPGVSFNLSGLMAVGGGERRPGGNSGEPSESAFAKYRDANPAQSAVQQLAPEADSGAKPNPFQQSNAPSASPFG